MLTAENGRMLLLTKYVIMNMQYHKERAEVTWENCSFREWLNDTFLNRAFSEGERELICTVTNENPDNPVTGTEGGNDTQDQLFLLSIDEVKRYLPQESERIAALEDNIENTWGTNKPNHDVNADWTLRTPGQQSIAASAVHYDGTIWGDEGGSQAGVYVDGTGFARIAMWVDASVEADELEGLLADKERADVAHENADEAVDMAQAQVGDLVLLGSWQGEDILWRVLDRQGDRLTVISKYVIDKQPFYSSRSEVSWESSTLRPWLNDIFFYGAFSAEEQGWITSDGSPTGDRVFLMSIEGAQNWFSSNEERMGMPAEYLRVEQPSTVKWVAVYWWLRSQGLNSKQVAGVDRDGHIHGSGDYPDKEKYVRPVINIRIPADSGAATGGNLAGEEGAQEERTVDFTSPEVVKSVQSALNAAGYDCGTPDGAAGQKTAAAVQAYQSDHGLEATGTIDAALIESLGL